jgi:hypothetical protein
MPMADIVQVQCPQCSQALRIPANWADKPLRCKFCKEVFQAKIKAARPAPAAKAPERKQPAAAAKTPSRKPPAASVTEANPFAFDEAPPPRAKPAAAPVQPKSPKRWLSAVVGLVVLVIAVPAAGYAVYLLGSTLWNGAPTQVAQDSQAAAMPKKDSPKADPISKTNELPKAAADNTVPAVPNTEPDPPPAEKKSPPAKEKPVGAEPPPKRTKDVYPRRALLISVNDYAFANPVVYGRPALGDFHGSSPGAFGELLHVNLDFPRNQIAELSDKAAKPTPPVKSAIENTIVEFLATARAQDHIVLFFAGHAAEIGNEAFLVPLDGKLDDPQRLISIGWLFGEFSKCKARQKMLILDVCRFDPGRAGLQPGSEPMGNAMEARMRNPPAGVEIWLACGAKEQSIESDRGGLFLEMVCKNCVDLPTPPAYSIPIKKLAARVRMDVEERSASIGHTQTPVLFGPEPAGPGPFNSKEAQPPAVAIKPPTAGKEKVADAPGLKSILDEISLLPPATGGKAVKISPSTMPEVQPNAIEPYKADYASILDYRDMEKEFPLRCTVARAIVALQENSKTVLMRTRIEGKFQGKELEVFKNQVFNEQKRLAEKTYHLKEMVKDMKAIGEKNYDKESKRIQVLFDFVTLRLKSRIIYVEEYNFLLAKIRGDSLPPLEEGDNAYRLVPQDKLSINEGLIKEYAKEVKRGWTAMVKDNPGTPWAIVAASEQQVLLGLSWKSMKK